MRRYALDTAHVSTATFCLEIHGALAAAFCLENHWAVVWLCAHVCPNLCGGGPAGPWPAKRHGHDTDVDGNTPSKIPRAQAAPLRPGHGTGVDHDVLSRNPLGPRLVLRPCVVELLRSGARGAMVRQDTLDTTHASTATSLLEFRRAKGATPWTLASVFVIRLHGLSWGQAARMTSDGRSKHLQAAGAGAQTGPRASTEAHRTTTLAKYPPDMQL